MTITNVSPSQFNFLMSNQQIGYIRYYIEYNQITIIWLCILLAENRNKGYGSEMIRMFIKYVKKSIKKIDNIVLIPDKFDGINKNILCNFYEKNGFIQEAKDKPFYIFNLEQ
jgi:RimJ/RimL family protein N-acetyltransferase